LLSFSKKAGNKTHFLLLAGRNPAINIEKPLVCIF
jgi:hypothetical protein